MAITKRSPVTLSRTSEHKTRTYPGQYTNLRELGQSVAFYFYDNQLASKPEATHLGMAAEAAFKTGQSFTAHGVTFTIEPVGKD